MPGSDQDGGTNLPPMHQVLSSHIAAVGHDGDFLYVEFIDGKVARYNGVPPDVVQQLRDSPSVGKTFNELVRGQTSFSYVPKRGAPDDRASGATR